jgi:hypothetical protein
MIIGCSLTLIVSICVIFTISCFFLALRQSSLANSGARREYTAHITRTGVLEPVG